jgi:hypothetical protein
VQSHKNYLCVSMFLLEHLLDFSKEPSVVSCESELGAGPTVNFSDSPMYISSKAPSYSCTRVFLMRSSPIYISLRASHASFAISFSDMVDGLQRSLYNGGESHLVHLPVNISLAHYVTLYFLRTTMAWAVVVRREMSTRRWTK